MANPRALNGALSRALAGTLDWMVAPAFGAPGFAARAQSWSEDGGMASLTGRRIVVTGANAGLGRAIAEALAQRGARVDLVCRNPARGERAERELAQDHPAAELALHRCDLGDLEAVRELAAALLADPAPIDAVVHNAGALLAERQLTREGLETTFAVHVAGPFLLTALVRERLVRDAPSRVVWVTSGGMYTQRLRTNELRQGAETFDGVVAYAQCKRAQVELMQRMHTRLGPRGVQVSAMHPGWADTGGVREALPGFHRVTRSFLRNAAQGADTAVWLAASTEAAAAGGLLFLDRLPRRTHLPLARTHTPAAEVDALWALCERVTGERWPT